MLKVKLAETVQELAGILSLQQQNLPKNLSAQELEKEGFVTLEHNMDILFKMNAEAPSIIAKEGEEVVGYCLGMTKSFREVFPILIPMFDEIDSIYFQGKGLDRVDYIISGQVCIGKAYRGQGLLGKMYGYYQQVYHAKYPYLITEISARNPRSVRAHEKVGFQVVHTYSVTLPKPEEWIIVLWDWNSEKAY
ncbi:MAG: GNAT family N-acetyltransferase [Bacteroidota bacterium]